MERVDVLVVGAGLSGIGAACHLRQKCPEKSFVIFERRAALGGTWNLFRYPGVSMLRYGRVDDGSMELKAAQGSRSDGVGEAGRARIRSGAKITSRT
jgi:monoamine oxidase